VNIAQVVSGAKNGKEQAASAPVEGSLGLLIEGLAEGLPQVDPASYGTFRANMGSLATQMVRQSSPADHTPLIRKVLGEVETYRNGVEKLRRVELMRWRILTAKLVSEVVAASGVNATSSRATQLQEEVERLETSLDVERFTKLVDEFLRTSRSRMEGLLLSGRVETDRSTTNDNAAGLRGGGSAVEYVAKLMDRGDLGYVVVFRLGCLEVISDRYGMAAVEDCLMAIASYLTRSLRREDSIFHWSDSSILAVLQRRANEQIVSSEVLRIAAQNREIAIQIAGRAIVLHVPIEYEVTPIGNLHSAEDLYHPFLETAAPR
jgi:GGDEF domain-containing protein